MDQNCSFVHTINVVVVVVVAVIAVVDCALSIPPHSLREEFLAVKVLLPRAVYAVVVCPSVRLSVRLSVCHKPVLYRNDWTNRAGFWHGGFLPPVPLCVIRKFVYLKS